MAFQTFPLAPAPSYYTQFNFVARNGVHYVGQSVIATLDKATATDYQVVAMIDSPHGGYEMGDIVATGAVTGTTLNLGSDFLPGSYRIWLTGASSDSLFGDSYGAANFAVINTHPHFAPVPVTEQGIFNMYIPNGSGYTDEEATVGGFQNFDSGVEMITRACLGIGMGRLSLIGSTDGETDLGQIGAWHPNEGGTDGTNLNEQFVANALKPWWTKPTHTAYLDPVRERLQFIALPNITYDTIIGEAFWLQIYCKTPDLDGGQIFIETVEGGGSGGTDLLHVHYPAEGTIVETFDGFVNQDEAVTIINAGSDYLKVFRNGIGSATRSGTYGPVAIGNSRREGVISSVAQLYDPDGGITRFEGPYNEPPLNTAAQGVEIVHQMMLFQAYVHAGHPDAKAIGPCPVSITSLTGWESFLAAGGGDYCDEISFHDYNSIVNGDINCGRNTIEAFLDLLDQYGQADKLLWQTEATHNFSSIVAGVYHPGRSRVTMAMIMLWEQYGIPFERNPYWYDGSHGFWGYSSFMLNADRSPNPQVVTMSVYAYEVFGKAFHHPVDFGHVIANRMFVGNVYGSASTGSVAALMCASDMVDSTVTLEIIGTTDDIVVVDSAGNSASYAQSSGLITIPVLSQPSYVRMGVGVNMRVDHIRDWSSSEPPSVSSLAATAQIGGLDAPEIADDLYLDSYIGIGSDGVAFSNASVPDSAEVIFSEEKTVGRVITFHGPAWEAMSYPLDYTVDTIASGTTFPTRVGPSLPGTAANDASAGDVAWASVNNVLVDDTLSAGAHLDTAQTSQYLFATNFGFSIPGGATIIGVVLDAFVRTTGGTSVVDHTVKLIDAGVLAGTNKAVASLWTWDPGGTRSWGGGTDLWGIALTPAKINASNFGVGFRNTNLGGDGVNTGIDYAKLTVYYTEGTYPLPWDTQSDPDVVEASSVLFGSDFSNAGCQRETYTKERWITDDSFTPVVTQAIRVNVAAASYGGEPDADCIITTGGLNLSGHGMETPALAIQEIAILSTTIEDDDRDPPASTRPPRVFS